MISKSAKMTGPLLYEHQKSKTQFENGIPHLTNFLRVPIDKVDQKFGDFPQTRPDDEGWGTLDRLQGWLGTFSRKLFGLLRQPDFEDPRKIALNVF